MKTNMIKLLRDTYLIGLNELIIAARNPIWLFFGLFQPIVYLLLFSPFLSGIADAPGFPGGNAIQFFVPGLLIMNVLFGAGFAGFGLIDQLRTGFIERIRVTPVSRLAIVLGLILRQPVVIIVQSVILVIFALFFGFTIDPIGALILLILMALIAITMAAFSFTIGLMTREEGTLAAVTNFITLPLFLLAGVMLPVSFAPQIMQNIAQFDPFTHAVDAARALTAGAITDSSVGIAFVFFSVLCAITLGWFIRSMREAVS
jgi:ABC-2 type transport system permease protein